VSIREIVLDTETTGLSPRDGHRVVEIGAVEMINKVVTGNNFHCYINPDRDMPDEAYRVHGLSGEFLKTKQKFHLIADQFLDFIAGSTLVIHNAPFDLGFLNHELSRVDRPLIEDTNVIDTLKIARQTFPGSKVSLDALCKRFKVDNKQRTLHGALIDAKLLAYVYIELTGGRQEKFNVVKSNRFQEKIDKSSGYIDTKLSARGNGIVISPTIDETLNHQLLMKKIVANK
jgi:DNA polymerase-3 subunit epsilon